ncbi:antitoxin PaaA2 family protein [Castellaniella caeni]|uniref:antitoxin PaaA2 family protein n=1 Tax=Castellaniella caeni TaxID=266123 RepID=UPI000833CC67|nr:hypothetical protein [Castellaniella caeni]
MMTNTNFDWESVTVTKRPDRSAALKRAHEAAAYDAWFRDQVQASIDDPRPNVTDAQASAHMERVFTRLEKKAH